MSNGDIIAPPPQRTGGGREDKVGLNRVTFPFKCLLFSVTEIPQYDKN